MHPQCPPRTARSARLRSLVARAAALAAVLALLAACQGDLQSRLAEIQALQEAGEFDASIEPLRGLITTHSSHPEVNFRLGLALVQTGRRSLAIWPLQKASQTQEYAVPAGILLASTLLATQDYEESVRAATRVLETDPQNKTALYTRARAQVTAGNPALALDDTDQLLALDPEDEQALTLRIGALVDLDRAEDAEAAQLELRRIAIDSGNDNLAAGACGALALFYNSISWNDKAEATHDECVEAYPGQVQLRAWASDFYLSTERPERAIALWQEAIDESPENPELRSHLGRVLLRDGRRDEALALLTEMTELYDTVDSWRSMAAFHDYVGDVGAAREALEQALERAQGNSRSLRFDLADALVREGKLERAREMAQEFDEPAYRDLLLGEIELYSDNPKRALELFEAGLRRWPNNANARYLAGLAAEELGDIARARAEYREAIRNDERATDASLRLARLYFVDADFRAARQFAERHVDRRPFRSEDGHVLAARAAAADGELEAAEKILNDLLRRPGYEARAWAELADLGRRARGPAVAVDTLEKSGLDFSAASNEIALRVLVQSLLESNRTDEALARVNAALAARPNAAPLLDLEGRILASRGDVAGARSAFERAVAADAEYASAYEGQGSLAAATGDYAAALGYFDRAAELDPSDQTPAYLAAHALEKKGDRAGSIQRLRAVTQADPTHVGAANDLAFMLAQDGGDLDEALALAKRANLMSGGNATTIDTLGWVQLKRGDTAAAAKNFQLAIQRGATSPSVRYHLGMALAKQGEVDAAAVAFREALDAGSFPEAAQAKAELARLETK